MSKPGRQPEASHLSNCWTVPSGPLPARQAAGLLHSLANKLLDELTAADIREAYDTAIKKSPRRADYAMQVLRAALRWNGVVVNDNPLGRETAGRDRIMIAASRGDLWMNDPFGRNFAGLPPSSSGDFAWVQHMVKSMADVTVR